MTDTRTIIERAYRKIGVVAADTPMDANEAANGLAALNAMMHGWALFGVDIEHTDLALTDAFPMLPRFEEGVVYLLASRLAPDSSVAAPDPAKFMRAIQAYYMQIEPLSFDRALRLPPSAPREWTE